MSDNSSRSKALNWWRELNGIGKQAAVKKWRDVTNDSKRDWPFELISMSSSTIEQIWLELEKAKQQS
jgi:poly(3-hydroxybutyrate) depolymerase